MNRRQLIATAVIGAIAFPLVVIFAVAIADARVRSTEAPFRAVLGNARFEQLMEGEGGVPHYLGASLSAPSFELPERSGDTWSLADQRGKVIVMNFWTVTCRPCIQEMPTLELLAEITKGWDDVEVVAVSTDRNWAEVDAIIPERSEIVSLLDADRSVVNGKFCTKLFPETWIIDKNGLVRLRFDGAFDWASPVALDLIRAYR